MVAVDGVIFNYQRHGGITRMLSAVLPRLLELDESLWMELWGWRREGAPPPRHERIEWHSIPSLRTPEWRPGALGRRARVVAAWLNEGLRRRAVRRSTAFLWHSTLYWRPPDWPGRVLTTVYDLKEELFPDLAARRDMLRYKNDAIHAADHLLCISETTRRGVMKVYDVGEERTTVLPLAVDHEVYRPPRSDEETANEPFLLFVGRRDRFKNADVLLNTFGRWPRRHDFRLFFVGPPLGTAERRHLKEGGVEHRVRVFSGIGDHQLAELYRTATALVYPSLYEGFGLPLVEAMACGCPVVASSIPSSLEVAGDAALYFDPRSSDELSAALDAVVSAGRDAARVGRGLKRAHRLSWDDAAQALLAVYRGMVGMPGRAP